jgi:hypothetical protein
MHPDELARLVDAELKRLPAPRAPATLRRRVLAAVRAVPSTTVVTTVGRRRSWPLFARVGAAAAAVSLVGGLWLVWPLVQGHVFALASAAAEGPLFRLVDVWRQAEAISTAADVIWRVIFQPVGWALLPLVLLMWIACATFGAALSRVALGGAAQS